MLPGVLLLIELLAIDSGFLDVTAPPYSVDNTGRTDVSDALQKVFIAANNAYQAAFLPHGTYLVSKPLELISRNEWDPGKSAEHNNTWPCRFKPNVVLGARAKWAAGGGPPIRPVIRLADNAPGFGDPTKPMPVLQFMRTVNNHQAGADGTNFNQYLRGIDIVIGSGTPGAAGVTMPGAQGCSVQDSTITVGSGYAGLIGGSGAGGGHTGVRVVGGRIGLDFTVSLNAPGTTAVTLLGQTEASILYNNGMEAATFVGAYIEPASPSVPALLSNTTPSAVRYGQVSMVDSVISYSKSARPGIGGGPASPSLACVAFRTTHSLYLNNVFVRGCANLTSSVAAASTRSWTHAKEVASGVDIPTPDRQCDPGATMPVYLDGVRNARAFVADVAPSTIGPPANMTSQHVWDERTFPTWDQNDGLLVDASGFGATGDGSTDDAAAIQRAIDAATPDRVVFLPKGFYRLSRTLNLTCAGFLGASRLLSVLMPLSSGLMSDTAGGTAQPILHVPTGDGAVVLSMFAIVTWEHDGSTYALQWRNRNPLSVYRQCYFYRIAECFYGFPHPTPVPVPSDAPTIPCKPSKLLVHPLNVLEEGSSGRFYNFENEDFLYEAPTYRHLLVQDSGPLRFYDLNMEHATSETNIEMVRASDVRIYSLKTEGAWRDITEGSPKGDHNPDVALWLRNCSDVLVSSWGGNGRPRLAGSSYPPGFAQYPPSLIRVEDSCPITFANLVDQFQFAPDDDWNFVYDKYGGVEKLTAHCERPVLYKRDHCH